jgi:oxygen-independent coproporphyrinogen-3 oxidase
MEQAPSIQKYNITCPRYTSYPSIPYWKGIDEKTWNQSLIEDLQHESPSLSLYIHVPFCKSPCAFCGCTKIITRDRKWAKTFLTAIEIEAKNRSHLLPLNCETLECHIGGGTPTWLEASELEELAKIVFENFKPSRNHLEFSIEVDPRSLTLEHVKIFKKININRVSLGVQDFNEATMRAIARNQNYECVSQAVSMLRKNGISAINFDLVYGLPFQSIKSITDTFEKVLTLNPDRIAFYAYAHVPTLKPAQKYLEKTHLPDMNEKLNLFHTGRDILLNAGYSEIGMDHFGKKDDELYIRHKSNALNRNFMGYTTNNTNCLIGLGPSSISNSSTAFTQNEKDPTEWSNKLINNQSLIVHGHTMSEQDKLSQNLIKSVMCNDEVDLPTWVFDNKDIITKLDEMSADGLLTIKLKESKLQLSQTGRNYRRNIATVFDFYYSNKNTNVVHSRA